MSSLFAQTDIEFTNTFASSEDAKATRTLYENADILKSEAHTLKVVVQYKKDYCKWEILLNHFEEP